MLIGTRRKDLEFGKLHDNLESGDFWKILDKMTGKPKISESPSNLTKTCWYVVVPLDGDYGLGDLTNHTVREHDDGTISVKADDGSSNSILVHDSQGKSWHGYIDHGVFEEC